MQECTGTQSEFDASCVLPSALVNLWPEQILIKAKKNSQRDHINVIFSPNVFLLFIFSLCTYVLFFCLCVSVYRILRVHKSAMGSQTFFSSSHADLAWIETLDQTRAYVCVRPFLWFSFQLRARKKSYGKPILFLTLFLCSMRPRVSPRNRKKKKTHTQRRKKRWHNEHMCMSEKTWVHCAKSFC